MSDYRLVVTREEPNPDFEAQQADYERRRNYYDSSMVGGPSRTLTRQVLDVTLTEAEYVAVKKAAIEAAK